MKLNEGTFEGNSIAVYDGKNGITQIYKRGNGYYGQNDDFDFHMESKAELEMMLKKWGYRLIAGGLKENKMKKLKESAMAELDIAAQEAPTFEAFVKTVKQEFPQLASDLNKPEVISFLQNMYDDAKMRENKTTMKKSQLEQLIREEVRKVVNEINYSKADTVIKGTFKRPEKLVDPETKKLASYLDKFVSSKFGYQKLEDLLNALEATPEDLEPAINVMKKDAFELNDGEPFYNLVVTSSNYKDTGVALAWNEDHWEAG